MSSKKILLAFFLNIGFSVFEFFGGILTNSVAIMSDAIHDFSDAVSIGISYFLERVSRKAPDDKYTYGYVRYSVLGALLTNVILIIGSVLVSIRSISRLINPVDINYDGMIIFALVGVIVNVLAVFFTHGGHSLNQKAVNLHMLEDVFGWIIVLVGAIFIKFTGINRIDSILSIVVSIFILVNALNGVIKVIDLFLVKTPYNVNIDEIRKDLIGINNVIDVHHIHVWSMDGFNNYATMHIVTELKNTNKIKEEIKEKLKEYNISHSTVEIESKSYNCEDVVCCIECDKHIGHHH